MTEKTILLSKSVIEKPEYRGGGDKSTKTYCNLTIPVILHKAVGGSKVSVLEKIPQ